MNPLGRRDRREALVTISALFSVSTGDQAYFTPGDTRDTLNDLDLYDEHLKPGSRTPHARLFDPLSLLGLLIHRL